MDKKLYQKQYYNDNKEAINKRLKSHYETNKEKINEQKKQYYIRNEKKVREQQKQYYINNKEKIKLKSKEYTAKNSINPQYIFKVYRRSAEKRGFEFNISLDFLTDIIKKPCIYCNKIESMGIDRINNDVGYVESNCAPCCTKCNRMKLDYTLDEFKEHITKIYNHLKDKT